MLARLTVLLLLQCVGGVIAHGLNLPALAAVVALATGIIGAVSARFILDALRNQGPFRAASPRGLRGH